MLISGFIVGDVDSATVVVRALGPSLAGYGVSGVLSDPVGHARHSPPLPAPGIEDLTALNALYRPGPIQGGMIDDFIERKRPARRPVRSAGAEGMLEETYGVIVYQEQVMQISNRLAGYSLGDADLLRRAMGKKKPEEMAKQRERSSRARWSAASRRRRSRRFST